MSGVAIIFRLKAAGVNCWIGSRFTISEADGSAWRRARFLLQESPAQDAQKRFDRWIVEFRLQPSVNRRPTTGAHLLVDDSISEFNVLFHIHVVWI